MYTIYSNIFTSSSTLILTTSKSKSDESPALDMSADLRLSGNVVDDDVRYKWWPRTLPLNTAWMFVDNTTRPAMELNLDIAVMFFVISSALFYYLDPRPRTRPPGRALDLLATPWAHLAKPSAPCLHPRPCPRPGPPWPHHWAPVDSPMSSCTLSTLPWSPSQFCQPSTSRGLRQPHPHPRCGWPPNECLHDSGHSVLQLLTLG